MSAMRIDGKTVSAALREKAAAQTAEFVAQFGRTPCLSVILVGEDPASAVYVRNKEKACAASGIESHVYRLPATASQEELDTLVDTLNADPLVDGILCQLPLPAGLNEERVINRICPDKDVDAFHPVNVGKIMLGRPEFLPCTPAGVMALLDSAGVSLDGKHCVVIGRSNIVGKPQALLLLQRNATVTICHSHTKNLPEITRQADVIVAAVGRPRFVTADMVKPGAVVIDVGINRLPDGTLCGDADFDALSEVASAITPVPGGVGPMTIAMLLQNTLKAANLAEQRKKAAR